MPRGKGKSAKARGAARAASDRRAVDLPAGRDRLGFRPHVEAVRDFLLEDVAPPVAISVEGGSGTGKTSFMLQLRGALEGAAAARRPITTVWVNAREHDAEATPGVSLALRIGEELAGDAGGAEPPSSAAQVHRWSARVVGACKGTVAVFIDDLDRCRPLGVADILGSVSLLLASEEQRASGNLVLVLAMDRERMLATLAASHEAVASYLGVPGEQPAGAAGPREAAMRLACSYLEKLIQVPVRVPVPRESDLRRRDGAESVVLARRAGYDWPGLLADTGSAVMAPIVEMAVCSLGENPRRWNRFLALLRLRARICRDTGWSPENLRPGQLAKVVIMELLWPEFLSDWRRGPRLLSVLRRSARGDDQRVDGLAPRQVLERPSVRWQEEEGLLRLIEWAPPGEEEEYSLTGLDIESLLATLPPPSEPGREAPGTPAPRVPAEEAVALPEPPAKEAAPQPEAVADESAGPSVAVEERDGRLVLCLEGGPVVEFVEIAPGTFTMGTPTSGGRPDESPPRRVTFTRPFYVATTPVTHAQYGAVTGGAATRAGDQEGSGQRPVTRVSWADASEFCRRLTEAMASSGFEARLPTEAEWEYAARGEEGRVYPWGKDEPTPELANFGENAGGTSPVGAYPRGATPEGLLDMAGNVWEWCSDWYGAQHYQEGVRTDPTGPATGTARVLRGGSWDAAAEDCRCARRLYYQPVLRSSDVGMRLVVSRKV